MTAPSGCGWFPSKTVSISCNHSQWKLNIFIIKSLLEKNTNHANRIIWNDLLTWWASMQECGLYIAISSNYRPKTGVTAKHRLTVVGSMTWVEFKLNTMHILVHLSILSPSITGPNYLRGIWTSGTHVDGCVHTCTYLFAYTAYVHYMHIHRLLKPLLRSISELTCKVCTGGPPGGALLLL